MRCNKKAAQSALCGILCVVLLCVMCGCGGSVTAKNAKPVASYQVLSQVAESENYNNSESYEAIKALDDGSYLLAIAGREYDEDQHYNSMTDIRLVRCLPGGETTVITGAEGEFGLDEADWIVPDSGDAENYRIVLQSMSSGDIVGLAVPQELQAYSKALYAAPDRWLLMRDIVSCGETCEYSTRVYYYDARAKLSEEPQVLLYSNAEGLSMDMAVSADGTPQKFIFLTQLGELTMIDAADGSVRMMTAGEDFADGFEHWRRYQGVWAVPDSDILVLQVEYDLNDKGDQAVDYLMLDTVTGEITGKYTVKGALWEYSLKTADADTLYFAQAAVSGDYNRLVSVDLANGEEKLLFAPVDGDMASNISDIRDVALLPDGSGILLMTAGQVLQVSLEDELQEK